MNYKNKKINSANLIRDLLIRTSFSSSFKIVLNNDGQEIWQRKKEDSLEDIEYAVKGYSELAEKYQLTTM